MTWLDKLEQKIGKLAVPHLMRYLVMGNVIVYILSLINANILNYLSLNPAKVLQGQVWRIFTFVFIPSLGGIFLTLISLFCYYWIGEVLERIWGSFRFTFYCLIGYLSILAVMFLLLLSGYDLSRMYHLTGYFYQSMFLALATLYPDSQVLMFYIIPMKAKWAGLFGAALLVYELIVDSFPYKMLILASFIAYFIFFLPTLISYIRNQSRHHSFYRKASSAGGYSPFNQKSSTPRRTRTKDYGAAGRKAAQEASGASASTEGSNMHKVAFHRCCVCGITELDDPNMTFRYCSQCNGNYEYCENHIYNHVHVK